MIVGLFMERAWCTVSTTSCSVVMDLPYIVVGEKLRRSDRYLGIRAAGVEGRHAWSWGRLPIVALVWSMSPRVLWSPLVVVSTSMISSNGIVERYIWYGVSTSV